MPEAPDLAHIASLIADHSRAAMLSGLMSGRELPATELARLARVTPQTASAHLGKLCTSGVITSARYGRHRYYRLASPHVAAALEALMAIAPVAKVRSLRESDLLERLRVARTCYDHLAGALGVAITQRMVEAGWLVPMEQEYVVSPVGLEHLGRLGIDIAAVRSQRRAFARQCLDWSERRPHVAGALGAALATSLLDAGWLTRFSNSRALALTEVGREGLRRHFGISHQNVRTAGEAQAL